MHSTLSKLFCEVLPKYQKPYIRAVENYTRENKNKAKSFLIVRAKPQDYCCVADMLWKYFYPDEPTILSLGLGTNYNPLFDEETLRDLAEGLSVLAKCKYSGNIIGGCINISSCPWDPDQYDKIAVSVSCPRLKKLYAFYAFLQRAPCLWERYCTNRVYEMKTLFVDTENRSKGMGHVLLEASRSLGINNGFKVIRCDATSYFTDKICTKMKMKMVYDIPYCSYTGHDPAHQPVFRPPPPHESCRVFIDTPLYN